ncbi:MAG TPA: ABC transporter permease [Thermoanaerobaculia bacterium]|nr:ABC transporter permease [Thermoanaerobaculia bacterium]
MSDEPAPPPAAPDWRAAVERHAARMGVELPAPTVDELAQHLDDLYASALAEGASPDAAHARAAAALAESSFAALRRHAARDPRRAHARFADLHSVAHRRRSFSLLNALRLAIRQLRQHPRFALVTMLVLGLGTGAATTIFTIVDSVVLRPLPYEAPDRLVTLWDTNAEKAVAHEPISPVNFMDYRALPVFADAAAWWRPAVNLVDPGLEPVRVNTIETSANLFTVLGVRPQLGRGFPPSPTLHVFDEPMAVISDRLWRTRYGADPKIVGRQLSLSGESYTVAGVMPPKFHYPDDVDVWQRLSWDPAKHSRQAHFMEGVARLAPGATFAQAQAACDTLALRLASQFAGSNHGWGVRLVPILDELLGYYRPALVVLFGAVGLLLVMGILNVASLLLTRTLSRQREIGVRIAVGAAPRQLVTQLFAESIVLSVGGAVAGLLVAAALLPLVVAFSPVPIPRLEEASLDWRALGVSVAIMAASTLVFGLVPALLLLRRQVTAELKSGDRGSTRAARRIYSVLVSSEVAVACSLLVCSALLVRTVREMTETPIGVAADDVLTASVQLTRAESKRDDRESFLATWRQLAETHARLLEAVRRQPGVRTAGAGNFLPLQVGWRDPFGVEGQPAPARPEDLPQAQMHSISDGWFEAMGARLERGRDFSPADGPDHPGVVIVNDTFAQRYLAAGGDVGRRLRIFSRNIGPLGTNLLGLPRERHDGVLFEVVGVVADVRDVPLGQPVEPAIYCSAAQYPFAEQQIAVRAISPAVAYDALRAALHEVAPTVPMGEAKTWGERFAEQTGEPRLLMSTLIFFGFLASLLAAIGVYGIFSWSVALRTRELAIRLTLGAQPASVGRLVVGQTAALVAVGLFIGLVLVRIADATLSRVLYQVSPHDFESAAAASFVLLAAALFACLAPARRAMRVDPVIGLRAD